MRRFILFSEIINAIIIKLFNSNFCHYINGPETLPPPLTKEEEQRVLQAITDGDESARDELITHNLRLVVYIAKKFDSPSASTEDLVSIGTIGLMKAVKTFAPEKNIKLATYASRCIENEILMYLRKTSNSKTEMSFDEPTLRDVLGSEPDEICQSVEYDDEKRLLRSVVSRLTPKERNIMELRFGLNNNPIYTQKQLADKMGISQSYISRLEKRILKKIRDEMQRQVACM